MSANATLTINFTSQYADGCHRVCYSKNNPLGPFTCSTVNCTLGIGVACSETILVTVNPEDCTPDIYYGYVQPCCEEAASLDGRVSWVAIVAPTDYQCISFDLLCNNPVAPGGPCAAFNVTDCDSNVVNIEPVALGDTVKICSPVTTPPVNAEFTITNTTDSCLCDCTTYDIENTDAVAHDYQYFDCTGTLVGPINILAGITDTICASTGTVQVDDPTVTITVIISPCS
jgi:hypothetical protein